MLSDEELEKMLQIELEALKEQEKNNNGRIKVNILNFKGVFVPERDITEALKLAKELRLKSVYRFIHPVALRIALKYALAVDDIFAKQQLTPEQEEAINKYVQQLLKDVEK